MSLDSAQRARTAAELRQHLEVSGLRVADVASWLGWAPADVESVLAMDGRTSPVDVWLLRDVLDTAVANSGRDAGGWTVMTDAARQQAQVWFRLKTPPPQPHLG